MLSEAQDTHQPIATSLSYQDQKPEASRRAEAFCRVRLPKSI